MFAELLAKKRGIVLVFVICFLAILVPIAWVIVNVGLSEILQVRSSIDREVAYYAACAGAELMYAKLKAIEDGATSAIIWGDNFSGSVTTNPAGGGTSIGTYAVSVDMVASDILGVVSTGLSTSGRTAVVSVKYGFQTPFTTGVPVGCRGAINMVGNRWWIFTSWVRAEGPVASGSTITANSYVQITGDTLENQAFTDISYWMDADGNAKAEYDTDGDSSYIGDTTGDGTVTIADCAGDPVAEAEFAEDDVTGNGEVNDQDAFYQFYTHDLDERYDLDIGPGEANYYNGDTNFGPNAVPAGTTIIFVNGDANILFNATDWSSGASDLTIVSMDDINIVQPINGSDDRLTLVSYDDVNTGGVGIFGGVNGEWIIMSNGSFNAYFGGNADGSIFAEDSMYVDTVLPVPGLLTRDFDKGDTDWSDPNNIPVGIPGAYPKVSYNFIMDDETVPDPGGYIPVWQRN